MPNDPPMAIVPPQDSEFTIPQAAAYLGVTGRYIKTLIRKNLVPLSKRGADIAFRRRDLDRQQNWFRESSLEWIFRRWLKAHGWQVRSRLIRQGPDIEAIDPKGTRWIFEVKGYPKVRNQLGMWFLYALGETIVRIEANSVNWHALVFPDYDGNPDYQKRSLKIIPSVRKSLRLCVFSVDKYGQVKVLRPSDREFIKWSTRLI